MEKSVLIALQVFGIGFVISFFIAILIKVISFSIRFIIGRASQKSDNA